jgi:uncharacterized protein with GYD domain
MWHVSGWISAPRGWPQLQPAVLCGKVRSEQSKGIDMAKYVLLMQYTDQGIRKIKDTTKRAAAFRGKIAGKFSVKVSEQLWTLGEYDLVVLAEAPNDEAMAACSLSLAKLGNVKIQTLRAFQASEVDALLKKL